MESVKSVDDAELIFSKGLIPWMGIDCRLKLSRMQRNEIPNATGQLFLDWQASSGLAPWQMTDEQLKNFLLLNGVLSKGLPLTITHARLASNTYPKHLKLDFSRFSSHYYRVLLKHLEDQIPYYAQLHPKCLERIIQQDEHTFLMNAVCQHFDTAFGEVDCGLSDVWGFPALHFFKKTSNGYLHQVWLSPYNSSATPDNAFMALNNDAWCKAHLKTFKQLLKLRLNLCNHLDKIEGVLGFFINESPKASFSWLSAAVKATPFQVLHLISMIQMYWHSLFNAEQVTEQSLNLASLRHVEVRISSAVTELIDLLQQGYLASRKVEATRKALRILDIALHCDLAKGNPEIAVKLLKPQINAFDQLIDIIEGTPEILTGLTISHHEIMQMYAAYSRYSRY